MSRNLQVNCAISFFISFRFNTHALCRNIRCDIFGILNFASKQDLGDVVILEDGAGVAAISAEVINGH